jgi:drug/metabolite transporter (DMT)-like permease
VWAALGALYLIWGSTYLAIRVMVETVPAAFGAGVRFVIAGSVLLGALATRGGLQRLRVDRPTLLKLAVIGTLLAAGGNGLVTVAEEDVPSGLAALVVASMPLWVVIYRSAWRDRVSNRTLVGVGVGFVGVALLMLPGNRPSGVPLGGTLLIVAAAASWGLGSFYSQRTTMPPDPLVSTGWQMLFGGIVMLIGSTIAGEPGRVDLGAFSTKSVLALVYLIVIGSLVAYSAYTWLLQNAPISQVATYAYVNPMVAVVLGWAILDEQVPAMMIAASAVIVASVAAIVRTEARPREPAVEPAS